ncbi:fucose isomerase [Aeoliella sp. ICT_H6.2]|uniref:Fucose isomerase n=1 Tax=Aeoliella straminimaris TaxID=2954799 RepID=A0A9X2FHL2_9BACT|nr:fucose isomerase [Aeoliella straminimaris]MCO6046191.1 fucose isomerase [Aeoliella straminimaris]
MAAYTLPNPRPSTKLPAGQVYLMANGDLRLSANQNCWAAQHAMEQDIEKAVATAGWKVVRAHPYKEGEKHGFISSQAEGMEVFRGLDPKAPLIVAEAVWQYSHHLLHGLISHQGPILTLANWSGTWPGLVGMLNLNGSLTKAGVEYSTLWADDFADPTFQEQLATWLKTGKVEHPLDHVQPLASVTVGSDESALGKALAQQLQHDKAIMGVFDEGCMGMFNAIIPDHLLNPTGVYKERLSQSALYYESTQVSDDEALAVRKWMEDAGMKFQTGPTHATDLTDQQILLQCKMYIAALRIADDFGCSLIGIQYQQGLKDVLPASDLVEGTLNNSKRPPVKSRDGGRVLYEGEPLPHFNEVDECAGLDGLMTFRVHKAMGQPVENTLHDLRWGDWDRSGTTDDYVWVFEISGSVPPAHLTDGWAGAVSERQPAMYFPAGGGTIKGISHPGEVVWSRVYVEDNQLKMDLGRAGVVELPIEETERRWQDTTSQWPIMHAVTYGVSRDQMMARHKSNHIQVAYANSAEEADNAMLAKAAMAEALGMEVAVCGTRKGGDSW